MTALVQVLSRISRAASSVDVITWKVLMVFCLAGLVISLICASNGVDLDPGFAGP
jgi:hypothetical protein